MRGVEVDVTREVTCVTDGTPETCTLKETDVVRRTKKGTNLG